MMKGGHGQTNQLHDINWGALDRASYASQLMSCNYYNMSTCTCVQLSGIMLLYTGVSIT